jgi:tRNA-splicing ligase RtcB
MISKKDFTKINDYLWEIPKTFRADMRVPARIYASEKILEHILQDQSVSQLINGATLPGIQEYSIAMPDCHEGYSVPIGFVGAIKISDGIISPGACGFDINCTSGNTKILSEHGAYLSIKELEKVWKNKKIEFVNFSKKELGEAKIFYFLKRYNNPTIYQIITESGEKIEVTSDHPMQTKNGMKEVKFLKEKDEVLIYPFKGVKYRKPSKKIILNEEKFKKLLIKLGKNNQQGNAFTQILNQLKSRDLLPLTYDSPYLPSILKIMGYIFGDGAISFGKSSRVQFYGKPEDLKGIQEDILKLGFSSSQVYSRKRDHSITTFYENFKFSTTEHSIKNNSSALASLLIALDTPYGLKSHKIYRVPKWIFDCSLWQKRLFLASFFGAELSTPSTLKKYNFYAPQFSVQKKDGLEDNVKLLLDDFKKLLIDFGVQTSHIQEVSGYRYSSKLGKTKGFRIQIKENAENLIKFFETISYEYNIKKQKEACLAANYLQLKLKIVQIRTGARKTVQSLYQRKGDFKKIAESLINKYVSEQFLYHSIFKDNRWGLDGKGGDPRIAFNFPSFKEFKESSAFGDNGLVWSKIERINRIPYADFVYDFTINDNNHNFIANSFVVSNCGMKLLKTEYTEEEIKPYLEKLATEIQKQVPSGLGKGRQIKFSINQIDKILKGGAKALIEQGYGEKEDIENCEAEGKLECADSSAVSKYAKNRGANQVGTLGSGNHFLEIQKVEKIFDEKITETFGLFRNQIVVMIHCGSRGLGHQVCADYIKEFIPLMKSKFKISILDREFACVPFSSPEGQKYFSAMAAAANYAWANRQMIAYFVRKAWCLILGEKKQDIKTLYDVAHNIIKKEKYNIDGKETEVLVHRKGATRAFPPGHLEIPEKYQEVGQPVLIPGSMGTASYILAGTEQGRQTFFSTSHGAGRAMSRHMAIKKFDGEKISKELKEKGIIIKCQSARGLAEEAPMAYKDIDEIIEVVCQAGLSKKVAKLIPLAVIKGE